MVPSVILSNGFRSTLNAVCLFTDMRRDVQDIFRLTPHEKQVMMFSATLSKEVRPVCKKFMQDVSTTKFTRRLYHRFRWKRGGENEMRDVNPEIGSRSSLIYESPSTTAWSILARAVFLSSLWFLQGHLFWARFFAVLFLTSCLLHLLYQFLSQVSRLKEILRKGTSSVKRNKKKRSSPSKKR